MAPDPRFSYELAFDRNIGWLTEWEQAALRGKTVAIAGLGGVGGSHLLALARLGIGGFHVADLDRFELANFNRQVGATVETLGRPKVDVLAEMALNINPEIRLKRFENGVTAENIDAFLASVDLFVDGFDFFALDIRRQVFARCAERGIPAVTAAPIGMGVGFLAFVPGGMTFEEYFRLGGVAENQQYIRFLMGLAPRGLHRPYLVDPSRVDIANHRGPSTVAACELCAGVTAVAAIKLLLKRGGVKPAPCHHHFDAYRGKLAVTRLRFGNAGPIQRAKLAVAERVYGAMSRRAPTSPQPASPTTTIERILDVARWAPSGDNCQPWRFRVADSRTVVLHLQDQSKHDIYDYRGGEPTLLSGGMLLESIRIAATQWKQEIRWRYEGRQGDTHRVVIDFVDNQALALDSLFSSLTLRSVDRRPYRMRALRDEEKQALAHALGERFSIEWKESPGERWRMSRLGAAATKIRLSTYEAFLVHQRVIDWTQRHSPTGIPAAATGLDGLTRLVMRWALRDWGRTRLVNRFGGPFSAAAQLDYLPGLCSAAYFAIKNVSAPDRAESLLSAGEGLQRFWLTATKLGLAIQPALATLIFASLGEQSAPFTQDEAPKRAAKALSAAFRQTLGDNPGAFVFLGRIGEPRPKMPGVRSTRRPLQELIDSALNENLVGNERDGNPVENHALPLGAYG
jgi:sulfur-carrier protein adenylyltransferase/sulfurtransferase